MNTMSETIHELPVDNIPLAFDERCFTTLPNNSQKKRQTTRSTGSNVHQSFLVRLIFSVYPKFQFMWIKMIPFKEEFPFSVS